MSRNLEQEHREGDEEDVINSHYSLKPGHYLRGQAERTRTQLERLDPNHIIYVFPVDTPNIPQHQYNRRKMFRGQRDGRRNP